MRRMTILLTLFGAAGSLTAQEPLSEKYAAAAQRLIAAALADDNSTARLQYLCDRIGNRLSGSESLEHAIQWSASEMKRAGLANVQTPAVMVPHWVRGYESAVMLAPIRKNLVMIGLGMSVGTPTGGITGDVVPVKSADELTVLGREKLAGKIVLFTPLANSPTVETGASRAAALGVIAVLIHTPHTRGITYDPAIPKIPAAMVSAEDALMMGRLVRGGTPVQVRLTMDDRQEPDAESHNVIAELPGSQKPEEMVVMGGHIDSWDIGQGAQDDGSGMMAALEAVLLIKKLDLQPKRTIRVVFWVNEENGGAGGRAYRAMIGDSIRNHVAAIEDDRGAEKPIGFGFGAADEDKARPKAFQRVVEIGKLLDDIDCGKIVPRGGGGDIRPLAAEGVPSFAKRTTDVHYSEWNHTNADSFDKIALHDFQLHVASLAVLSYVLGTCRNAWPTFGSLAAALRNTMDVCHRRRKLFLKSHFLPLSATPR